MKTISVSTLLPKIVPLIAGCNDDLANIILADAARTFARESDIVIETRGYPEAEAPEYGRMPEFALDPDSFVPLHFIARKEDKQTKRVYVTYSLLPTADLMPEAVIIRHYEAVTSQALFQLYSMPGKPWTSSDMANLYLQKYRIALGDAMRDNQTGGAVFDQYMLCGEPGDPGFIGAQNVSATVIGTDTSDGNITPAVVLAGYKGYAKGEMVVGEVPAMPQPTVSENVVTVYAGFNQNERVVTIPEAGALTVAKNKVTVPVGYIKSQRVAEIPVKTATLNENTVTIPEGYNNGQSLSVPVVSAVNDGEFVTVPVGYIRVEQKFKVAGGVEIDFVTATANDILAGKVGADVNGNPVYGNLQTVTATLTDNVVTVPKGNIAEAQTLTVAEMAEPAVSANVVTIPAGYNKEQKTVTIAEAAEALIDGSSVTVFPGFVKNQYTVELDVPDLSFITAQAEHIAPGYIGADKDGRQVEGSMPLATYVMVPGDQTDGVKISKGYLAEELEFEWTVGSSMEFYKCASVDTSAKTWTGYKAVLTDGVYSFEETLTTGLSYLGGMEVKKGLVYSQDAKLRCPYTYSPCVCLAHFDGNAVDSTGTCKLTKANQIGTDTGTVKFGFSSLNFNYQGTIEECYLAIENLPELDAFTFEFWENQKASNFTGSRLIFRCMPEDVRMYTPDSLTWEQGVWRHHAFVRDAGSTTVREYVNGTKIAEIEFSAKLGGNGKILRWHLNTESTRRNGYADELAIFDYAKYTADFTPPTSTYEIKWEDLPAVEVSGAGFADANGIYLCTTPFASGTDRVWIKPGTNFGIYAYSEWGETRWYIVRGGSTLYYKYDGTDPWGGDWSEEYLEGETLTPVPTVSEYQG